MSGDEDTVQSSGPLFLKEVEGEVSGLVLAVLPCDAESSSSSTSWSPLNSGIVDKCFLAVPRIATERGPLDRRGGSGAFPRRLSLPIRFPR